MEVKKIQDNLRVYEKDGIVTSDEMVQIIIEILQVLSDVKDEVDQSLELAKGEVNRSSKDLFDKARKIIAAASDTSAKGDAELKKQIDDLLNWRTSESAKTIEEDIATALEIGDENTTAIRNLGVKLKKLSREPGPRGKRGLPAAHEWQGSQLRFQNPDGSWGEWADLRGFPGEGGDFGGMRDLRPGSSNVSIVNDRIYVTNTAGSTQTIEAPLETPDDSTLVYTFTAKPFLVCVNQRNYRENHGWTAVAGVVTLSAVDPGPVGVGGDIYGIMQ